MRDFFTALTNGLTGENGPLYAAIVAITGLTLGWRFMGNNYSAEWDGGKIQPEPTTQKTHSIFTDNMAIAEPDS